MMIIWKLCQHTRYHASSISAVQSSEPSTCKARIASVSISLVEASQDLTEAGDGVDKNNIGE